MKIVILVTIILFISSEIYAGWGVDFSRRSKDMRKTELSNTKQAEQKDAGFFDFMFASNEPVQEVVLLNTDKGFVPATLRVKEGVGYKIHIVNVNEEEKNVSFVLDSFSEHHATYYGKIKTIFIRPRKEGIYSFQSPETSAQGRLVVYPGKKKGFTGPDLRTPAGG